MPLPQQAWHKIQWDYQCEQQKLPVDIIISHLNMAGKVYLNDDLLWSNDSLIEPLSRSWNTPYSWTIPASAINAHHNTLWIYAVGTQTKQLSIGHVHIAPSEQAQPFFKKYVFEQRSLIVVSLVIYFIVGIFYLIAWFIYRKEKAFFWMAMVIIFWMCYCILFSLQSTFLSSQIFDRLLTWLFSTYTLLGCIAIWRFANLRFKKIERCFWFIFIANTIILAVMPLQYLTHTIALIFFISTLIFLIRNFTYPFLIYRCKKIEVYFIACTHVIYIPIAIHDAHQVLTDQTNFWSPFVSPLSACSIGLILAIRLYRNSKEISDFNKHLHERIDIATQEREVALNAQHQLALENIKLQERMHLAHDLHDSLGGSLVRSIAIVNQSNDNLSNQQFLSMLKVLRDDLRQIIDSGSSAGNNPPATPAMWGAAIRYRFLQIFDELEIESVWKFPPTWVQPPTNFECLTFLRVIEEALTNIIKHSHAKNVKIELYYNDREQLELNIQDDGIGFDVGKVVDSGMSIGLRSMQVRLEKIDASLDVVSKSGLTILKVRRNRVKKSNI